MSLGLNELRNCLLQHKLHAIVGYRLCLYMFVYFCACMCVCVCESYQDYTTIQQCFRSTNFNINCDTYLFLGRLIALFMLAWYVVNINLKIVMTKGYCFTWLLIVGILKKLTHECVIRPVHTTKMQGCLENWTQCELTTGSRIPGYNQNRYNVVCIVILPPDLSLTTFCDFHLTVISQQVSQLLFSLMSLKIIFKNIALSQDPISE